MDLKEKEETVRQLEEIINELKKSQQEATNTTNEP